MTQSRIERAIAAALVLGLAFSGTGDGLRAQDPEEFPKSTLTVTGVVQDVIVDDFNGDGRKDLLVPYLSGTWPEYERWLGVFWYQDQATYNAVPDQVIAVDPDAVLIDTGDVVPGKAREIVYFTGDGVRYYPLEGETFGSARSFYTGDTFIGAPDPEKLPHADFVKDWDGDARDEVIVPLLKDALYFGAPETGAPAPTRIHVGTLSSVTAAPVPVETLSLTSQLPAVMDAHFNGDKRQDLVSVKGDQVSAFFQSTDENFPFEPSQVVNLQLTSEEERQEARAAQFQTASAGVMHIMSFDDLNKDDRIDIIASQWDMTGGFFSLKSEVTVYFNGAPGFDNARPSQTLIFDDAWAFAWPFDYNDDGQVDLVVGVFEVSLRRIIDILLRQRITIDLNVYYIDEDSRSPNASSPDAKENIHLKLNFKEKAVEGSVPSIEGDFNGDGKNDVIFAPNWDGYHVRLRKPGGRINQTAAAKIKAVVPKDFILAPNVDDLDGDGKADVIVHYTRRDNLQHNVVVVMNRKEW